MSCRTSSAQETSWRPTGTGCPPVIDAAVIVAAIEHHAAVLTSDPEDLTRLADAAGYPVRLLTV
ncbi:MAG: hypothetical protein M3R63_09520 [Actinomycetota bacterium]|nr:hypothetical protein [Actinomycetota bacterium]